MSLPLKVYFQDGQHLLIPVDPLSTFKQLQLLLPKLLTISTSESETLGFFSESDIIYPLEQKIAQINTAFVKVLFPLFSGVAKVNEDENLRKKHLVGSNFNPISDSYEKLIICSAIYKLNLGRLLTENELGTRLYQILLFIRFQVQINQFSACPDDIKQFVKHSQLNKIFSSNYADLYNQLREMIPVYSEQGQLQLEAINSLAHLNRFTDFLCPAVKLMAYNNGEVVRQISSKSIPCYISVNSGVFSMLDNDNLVPLEQIEIEKFVSLRYYSDCVVFEFMEQIYYTFVVQSPDAFYNEFIQYMEIINNIKNNNK